MRLAIVGTVAALAAVLGSGPSLADGYPPFYGYSPYFGGPTTYFTNDTDVQQVTTPRDGFLGFGVRTYYRGGPFWTYQPSGARADTLPVRRSRRVVLRRKG